MDKALIIFVKNLQMGKVKTRLAGTIGEEKAFSAYRYMLTYTSQIANTVQCARYVFYSEFIEKNDLIWNDHSCKRVQEGESLGQRMSNAFKQLFESGYKQVAIIGSDNLEITSDIIDSAFEQLHSSDVVMGPATDGGYYLLATGKYYPGLFRNIPWSTPVVLEETINVCKAAGIRFQLLPVLSDIDTEDDWKSFVFKSPGRNIQL